MQHKRAVFFDLDGTLINSLPDLLAALNVLLTTYQLPSLPFEKAKHVFQHSSSKSLKALFANTQHDISSLIEEYFKLYEARLTCETTLYAGVKEVLTHLDHEGIPWGVVTNKPYFLAEPVLRHFNLIDRSICLVCPETVNRPKPHADPLLHACQLANIAPQNAIYVGDTLADIGAAQAANMPLVLACYGYLPDYEALRKEVPHYIETPVELIKILHVINQA
jgi:phosphoglycolate phosphatase